MPAPTTTTNAIKAVGRKAGAYEMPGGAEAQELFRYLSDNDHRSRSSESKKGREGEGKKTDEKER